jgi:hypothetical protein
MRPSIKKLLWEINSMQSQRRLTKPLSIATHNLDFPDTGELMELYSDHAIVKLANGKLAYAFLSSHAKEEFVKLGQKFVVGSLVHVAIQRDMPKKSVQRETAEGEIELVEMDTLSIQEVQPTYPHQGVIIELTENYAVIRLEDGTTGKSVFSTAERQLMQERSAPSLALGQTVSVHLRSNQTSAIHHMMDLKEIGSPEPETAFLISPKGKLKIAATPKPLHDSRTIFSFLKAINTPTDVTSPSSVKLPTPPPIAELQRVESAIKREAILLNPKRTSATKEMRVATPLTAKPTVQFMNFMASDDKKTEKSSRRMLLEIPGSLEFKHDDERPLGYTHFLPSSVTQASTVNDKNLEEVHAAAAVVQPNVVVLNQLTTMQSLFPSIDSKLKKSRSSKVAPAEMITSKNNELYQVLKDVIARLQPLAVNKDDKKLMKNLFYIVNTGANEVEKVNFIIRETSSHNVVNINKKNMYAFQRSKMILSTLDGFCKLVASIQPGKNDATILPSLKGMLIVQTPTVKSTLPTIAQRGKH